LPWILSPIGALPHRHAWREEWYFNLYSLVECHKDFFLLHTNIFIFSAFQVN
jgi:hypothetical protein